MHLFYSPFHNFIHKTLVVAHEAGVFSRITFVPTYPYRNAKGEFVTGQYDSSALNPLAKVPFLATDDGEILYSSQVVAEYLDSLADGDKLYPDDGPERFDALRRLALGDAVFEFAVQMVMEEWRDADDRRADLYDWLVPKIERAFDSADAESAGWDAFDIGHAGLLQGVSFTDSWAGASDAAEERGLRNWKERWPALADWFEKAAERPSVQSHYGRPYAGDDSPENFRRAVEAVQQARAGSQVP